MGTRPWRLVGRRPRRSARIASSDLTFSNKLGALPPPGSSSHPRLHTSAGPETRYDASLARIPPDAGQGPDSSVAVRYGLHEDEPAASERDPRHERSSAGVPGDALSPTIKGTGGAPDLFLTPPLPVPPQARRDARPAPLSVFDHIFLVVADSLSRPSWVLGPVDRPPWIWQRPLYGSMPSHAALARHACPSRQRAPHSGSSV
jgi:hypothetical protein